MATDTLARVLALSAGSGDTRDASQIVYKRLKTVSAETLDNTEIKLAYHEEDPTMFLNVWYGNSTSKLFFSWGDLPKTNLTITDSNKDYYDYNFYYDLEEREFIIYTHVDNELVQLSPEIVIEPYPITQADSMFMKNDLYQLIVSGTDFLEYLDDPEWFEENATAYIGKYFYVSEIVVQEFGEDYNIQSAGMYKITGIYSETHTNTETGITNTWYAPKCKKVLSATITENTFTSVKDAINNKIDSDKVYTKTESNAKYAPGSIVLEAELTTDTAIAYFYDDDDIFTRNPIIDVYVAGQFLCLDSITIEDIGPCKVVMVTFTEAPTTATTVKIRITDLSENE